MSEHDMSHRRLPQRMHCAHGMYPAECIACFRFEAADLRAKLAAAETDLRISEIEGATDQRCLREVRIERDAALAQVATLTVAFERVARCLVTPNPGITDTIWMNTDPKSLGPTLYEFCCGALGREVKP